MEGLADAHAVVGPHLLGDLVGALCRALRHQKGRGADGGALQHAIRLGLPVQYAVIGCIRSAVSGAGLVFHE